MFAGYVLCICCCCDTLHCHATVWHPSQCVMAWLGSGSPWGVELWFSRGEAGRGRTTTCRLEQSRRQRSTRTGGTGGIMANTGGLTESSYSSKQVRQCRSFTYSGSSRTTRFNFEFLCLSHWSRPHPVIVFDVHRWPGIYERKIKRKLLSIFLLFCKCNM